MIEPDYFWRWREYTYQRVKVNNVYEQFSDVNANFEANTTALEILGINLMLSP